MPKIIETLHQDHRDFDKLLGFLSHQLELKDRIDELDYELAYDVMYYISHFPDRCHHPKEDLLYRKLCARDPSKTGYIHQLLDEHKRLAAKSLAFFEAIKNVLNDSIQSFSEFGETAKAFIELQREHIDKEEREVFPLLEQTLTQEDWWSINHALEDMLDENKFEQEDVVHRRNLMMSIVNEMV